MQADIWNYLKHSEKPILLYGMGNGAELIIERLSVDNVNISGVFASDEFVRGQSFHGFPVLTYRQAEEIFGDFIILTAFGTSDPDMVKKIISIAEKHELYIPDVPVCGRTVFDSAFYESNKDRIDSISQRFADERSLHVFESVVRFKYSASPSLLFSAEDDEVETVKTLIKLKNGAVIYDLGAYIGDTAEKFANLYPDYGKIVAVEPDRRNFARLSATTLRDIFPVNAAVSFLNGKVRFGDEGGRNQTVSNGDAVVESVTIDSLCDKFGPPNFIKFDIEGQEHNGLIGGEKTISEHRPALMISAYHRSEDIITIPEKVLSLNCNYKMYMRHFPCIPCWDTYYFFV